MKKLLFFLLIAIAISGCRETVPVDNEIVVEDVTLAKPAMVMSYAKMETEAEAPYNEAATIDQKIIKTANIKYETADLEATARQVNEAVKRYKGQIHNDAESNEYNSLNRRLTIRVPATSFENFIAAISKGVAHFDQKEISSQDVTEEYIDVEARIKTKKVLEARYLELLKKAGKVSEMLEIEKELSTIREEIEVQESRLRYMKNRVALSTVYLEFYKTTEIEQGATVSYGTKIGNAFKSGINTLSSFFIGILYFWPFILIFVIAYILIRRRIRKKRI